MTVCVVCGCPSENYVCNKDACVKHHQAVMALCGKLKKVRRRLNVTYECAGCKLLYQPYVLRQKYHSLQCRRKYESKRWREQEREMLCRVKRASQQKAR
jgi:hypothetical protein